MEMLRLLSIFSLLVICVYSWKNNPFKVRGIKSVIQLTEFNQDRIDTPDPSHLSSSLPPPPPRSSGEWEDWDQDRSLDDEFRNSDDFDDATTIKESNWPSMENNKNQSLVYSQAGFEDSWVEDPPYFDDVDDDNSPIIAAPNVNRPVYFSNEKGEIVRFSLMKCLFKDVPERISLLRSNFVSNEASLSKLDAKVTVQFVLLIALMLTQLYVIINL